MILETLFFFFACACYSTHDHQPKVSVVVPVYNMESRISNCLDSILNQTLKDIEIICIDDGSVDNSLKILSEYAKKNKKITVIHQENCGPSCARNAGISLSKGEYISFVDSDDWIDFNCLEIVYNGAKENDVDVAVFWGPWEYKILRGIDAARYFLPGHNTPPTFSKMYKTSLIKKNNVSFDISTRFGEDRIFNLDIVPYVDSVLLINRTLYHYNRLPNGLSNKWQKHINSYHVAMALHVRKVKDNTKCKNCLSEKDFDELAVYLGRKGIRVLDKQIKQKMKKKR